MAAAAALLRLLLVVVVIVEMELSSCELLPKALLNATPTLPPPEPPEKTEAPELDELLLDLLGGSWCCCC